MARTILEERVALILGVENAVGRSAAQQLSRAGCRVILASHDEDRIDHIAEPLKKKGGKPVGLVLPYGRAASGQLLVSARDGAGHIHLVVNALAVGYQSEDQRAELEQQATATDALLASLLHGRGPLKMVTAWTNPATVPAPANPTVWHSILLMPDCQRLDTQMADQIDAEAGRMHVRAGAAGDAVVFLLQMPPSACPRLVRLEAVPSSEKKE